MGMNDEPEDHASGTDWQWIARYLDGRMSEGEQSEFAQWVHQSPERQEALRDAERIVAEVRLRGREWDPEPLIRRLHQDRTGYRPSGAEGRIPNAPVSGSRLPASGSVWKAALAAALVLGVGLAGATRWGQPRPPGTLTRELTTSVGERAQITLSDGSQVTVGPNSRLVYPAGPARVRRELFLQGEAEFKVQYDARRPFLVSTAQAVIEDLGTRFVIRADSGAPTRVAVTEGSVDLRPAAGGPGRILRKGDWATVGLNGLLTAGSGDLTQDIAWLESRFVFVNTPMPVVVSELNRWYPIEVRLGSPSLGSRRLTGAFDRNGLEQILTELCLALNLRYTRDNGAITLLPR